MQRGVRVENEEHWPLNKRVEELLHTLVVSHRRAAARRSPEFRAYRSASETFDWLEHAGIERHRNRVPVQIEDVGTLRARRLVVLVGDRRDDKTFDVTNAGFEFHDEHCTRDGH